MLPEQLIKLLINGQITREEFEEFLNSLDDEDNVARYEMLLKDQFEREIEEYFTENDVRHQVPPKFKVLRNTSSSKGISHLPQKRRTIRFSIAAAIVLLVSTVISGWFIITQFNKTDRYLQRRAQLLEKPQIITKSTPRGRMFRMKMNDGSLVHLNAQSSISYPTKFGSGKREVKLEGEAYFDVAHDESRPFTIKVGDYRVDVLGTSFNIEAYDKDEFSVTVETGIVKVMLDKSGENTVTLTRSQKLIYNPELDKVEIIRVDPELELSWRDGILRFDKTPMTKVEKMIERWYGVELVIENKEIYDKMLTGTHQNKSLKSVLEALTYATGTKYEINDQSISIKLKNMNKP